MTTAFTHTPRAPLVIESSIKHHWYTHDGKFISAVTSACKGVRITAMRFDADPVAELEMEIEHGVLRDCRMRICTRLTAARCLELARCLVDAAHDIETRQVDIQEGKPGACGKGIQ